MKSIWAVIAIAFALSAEAQVVNLNDTTPGAPTGALNLKWQRSGNNASGYVKAFAASGTNHALGLVPDPGSSAGTTRFLREDSTWQPPLHLCDDGITLANTFLCTGSGGIQTNPGDGKAGFFGISQGTAQSIATNTIGHTAPSSVTGYNVVEPGAAGNGIKTSQNSANVVTEAYLPGSLHTVLHGNASGPPTYGAVDLTQDVSNVLPLANQGSRLLNTQYDGTSHTGTGAASTIFTYTLPANTMGSGGCIRINTTGAHTTGTASIAYTVTFGGSTTGGGFTATTSGANGYYIENIVCNKPGVANAQMVVMKAQYAATAVSGQNQITTSIDTTSAVVINFTFNVASTDAVTAYAFIVERL